MLNDYNNNNNNNNNASSRSSNHFLRCRLFVPQVTSATATFSPSSSHAVSADDPPVSSCASVHEIAKIGEINSLSFPTLLSKVKWFSLLEERESSRRCTLSWQEQQQQVSKKNKVHRNIFTLDLFPWPSAKVSGPNSNLNFESLVLESASSDSCVFEQFSPTLEDISAMEGRYFVVEIGSGAKNDGGSERICRGFIHLDYVFNLRISLGGILDREGRD